MAFTEKQIKDLGNYYLSELKKQGRQFNPIRFRIKSRKAAGNFGKAIYTFSRLGYDTIEINQYIEDIEEVKNTIVHELAHCDLFARGKGHGYEWKKLARTYGQWFNMEITRTSNKEIAIPGMVEVHVVWTEKCLKMNNHLRGVDFVKKYTSVKRAENFVKKHLSIGFIESYKIVKA